MSVNLTKQILEEMIQKEMNSLLLKEVRETSAEKNRRISQKNVLTKFKNMNAQKITSMINDSSLIKVFDDLDEQIYFLYSPLAGSEGRNISAYSINMFKPAWWADSQSGVEDLFHAINRWFKNSSGPGISKAKIKENYKVAERFYYDTNSTLRTAKRKIPKKYYSQAIQNIKKLDKVKILPNNPGFMDYLVSPLMGITRGYEEVFLSVTGIEDKAIKFNEKTVNDAKEFKGNLERKIDNIMSSVRRYKDDLDDDYKALMGKTDKERQASIDKEKSEKARYVAGVEKDRTSPTVYNLFIRIDDEVAKAGGHQIPKYLLTYIPPVKKDQRRLQNLARLENVKNNVDTSRIKKLKIKEIIPVAKDNKIYDDLIKRLKQYNLIGTATFVENKERLTEQNTSAQEKYLRNAIKNAKGDEKTKLEKELTALLAKKAGKSPAAAPAAKPAAAKKKPEEAKPEGKEEATLTGGAFAVRNTPAKKVRQGGGGRRRRGRFMRGQESFRAEFEARFGTGREGFEEFYDNLALHGIKIKEDGIFGKNHERAFKKYLVMQSKNPKITKGSETKKPEEVKAERPKYYAEKEAAEKKVAQKKKLLPPEVAKRRLRAGYTQKLQDIFQKAGTPIAWQSMYDKLKRRMVMAYTNMTGEKLDSVDEREADALMQTVLPSLASKDFRSMGELDLNLLALGRQPVFIELAGTFKRGFFIPFDTVVKKQVEQWKASFKA